MANKEIQSFFNYLEYEKRYSKNTIIAYGKDIDQFWNFLIKEFDLDTWSLINHNHVRTWMVNLVESGIGQRSITRKISSLRTLFLFLKKKGTIIHNPMVKVRTPKFGKTLPETVHRDRLEKLFDTIVVDEFADFRNRLIIELFYSTGMRRSELIQLKTTDIDASNSYLKVLGKGNKERLLPLSKDLLGKLIEWIKIRNNQFEDGLIQHDYLFVTDKAQPLYPKWVYNMVKKYLASVTTQKKKSPHVLRHSFATHLMDEGAELNAVKDLLGHANLAATQVYTHNSIEKLKSVYKFAHPRNSKKT